MLVQINSNSFCDELLDTVGYLHGKQWGLTHSGDNFLLAANIPTGLHEVITLLYLSFHEFFFPYNHIQEGTGLVWFATRTVAWRKTIIYFLRSIKTCDQQIKYILILFQSH